MDKKETKGLNHEFIVLKEMIRVSFIQTETYTAPTLHTNPKHMHLLISTNKALRRCSFCVVEIIRAKLPLQTVLFTATWTV